MPDNPNVVALLKEFKDEASLTRTEAGRIIGQTRGTVAGICYRNGIEPWPSIPKRVKLNRGCQFPVGVPDTPEFHLCGMFRESDPLLCSDHKDKVWKPQCQMLSIKK